MVHSGDPNSYVLAVSRRGGQAVHPVLPRSILLPLTFAEDFLVAIGQLGSQMHVSQRYKIGAGLWEPVRALGEHVGWPYCLKPLSRGPFLPSSRSRLCPRNPHLRAVVVFRVGHDLADEEVCVAGV